MGMAFDYLIIRNTWQHVGMACTVIIKYMTHLHPPIVRKILLNHDMYTFHSHDPDLTRHYMSVLLTSLNSYPYFICNCAPLPTGYMITSNFIYEMNNRACSSWDTKVWRHYTTPPHIWNQRLKQPCHPCPLFSLGRTSKEGWDNEKCWWFSLLTLVGNEMHRKFPPDRIINHQLT